MLCTWNWHSVICHSCFNKAGNNRNMAGRNVKWFSCCEKQYGDSSENLIVNRNMIQQFHFWIYTQRSEEGTQTDIWTPMFIPALFNGQKVGATQVSISRWMKKMSICTMGSYWTFRRKEILTYTTTWRILEHHMRSEISQSQKHRNGMILLIWYI